VIKPSASLVVGLGLILTACGGGPPPDPDAAPQLSPFGEPLSGAERSCKTALTVWARRLGASHDGSLSRAEWMANAEAQFARMDLDHDGFITADELSDYRAPFRPRPPRHKPGGFSGDGGPPPRGGAPAHKNTSIADPVMSADTNLDFQVSRDEFRQQAASLFDQLDHDQSGRLELAEVQRFCLEDGEGHQTP